MHQIPNLSSEEHNMCRNDANLQLAFKQHVIFWSQLLSARLSLLLQGNPARTQSSAVTLTSVQPCLPSRMRQVSAARTRLSAIHVADSTERAIEDLATTLSASWHHYCAMPADDRTLH